MTLRLGLAGLGAHGQRYADHLLAGDVPGARLTAVCRRDASSGRAFCGKHGLKFAGTPDDLATDPDVDAVVLALPGDRHADAALACVQQDRPVLVEKPLGADVRDAARVARAVEARGAFLMVAQTLRYDSVVQALREEIPALGRLRTISIHQRCEPSTLSWLDDPGPGGMALNTGVHGFDLLRYLTGLEPVSVLAQIGQAETVDTEDHFMALFLLQPGDVMAVVDNARCTRSRSGRVELVGDAGQIWCDHVHRTITRLRDRKRTALGPVAPRFTLPVTLQRFVTSIREGRPPEISAIDGLRAVEMAQATLLSARSGRRVSMEEVRV